VILNKEADKTFLHSSLNMHVINNN